MDMVEAIQLQVCLTPAFFRTLALDVKQGSITQQILKQVPLSRLLVPSAEPYLDAHFLDLAQAT